MGAQIWIIKLIKIKAFQCPIRL